eukprot:TRINITY_DN81542_c0_g1_i1.p1 TRINITY_DN81542_c0_g1~~TRINITY_DN81542_c0_g1_i1.p1  ORF type:complete len:961 (-),score=276.14 TRINITY_DN81542_c0_g1_i1:108-2990(-)
MMLGEPLRVSARHSHRVSPGSSSPAPSKVANSASSSSELPVQRRATTAGGAASSCGTPRGRASSFRPQLEVGQRVTLKHQGNQEIGTIRWLGALPVAEGDWAGVELDRPAGKHDGVGPDGQRYFDCNAKCGLFVRPNACVPVLGTQTAPKPEVCAQPVQPAARKTLARKSTMNTLLEASDDSDSDIQPQKSVAPQKPVDQEARALQERLQQAAQAEEDARAKIIRQARTGESGAPQSPETACARASADVFALRAEVEIERRTRESESAEVQALRRDNADALARSREELQNLEQASQAREKQREETQEEVRSMEETLARIGDQQARLRTSEADASAEGVEARRLEEALARERSASTACIEAMESELRQELRRVQLEEERGRHKVELAAEGEQQAVQRETEAAVSLAELRRELYKAEQASSSPYGEEIISAHMAEAAATQMLDTEESEVAGLRAQLQDEATAVLRQRQEHEQVEQAVRCKLEESRQRLAAVVSERTAFQVELETMRSQAQSEAVVKTALAQEHEASNTACWQEMKAAQVECIAATTSQEATESECKALASALRMTKAAVTSHEARYRETQLQLERELQEKSEMIARVQEERSVADTIAAQRLEALRMESSAETVARNAAEMEAAALRVHLQAAEASSKAAAADVEQSKRQLADVTTQLQSEAASRSDQIKDDDNYLQVVTMLGKLQADCARYEKELAARKSEDAEKESKFAALQASTSRSKEELQALRHDLSEQVKDTERQTEGHQQEIASLAAAWRQELEDSQHAHVGAVEQHKIALQEAQKLRSELHETLMDRASAARGSMLVADCLAADAGDKVSLLKNQLTQVKTLMKDVKGHKMRQEQLREELQEAHEVAERKGAEMRQKSQELAAWKLHVEATKMELKVEQQAYADLQKKVELKKRKSRLGPQDSIENDSKADKTSAASAGPRGSFFGWLSYSEPDNTDATTAATR